MAVLLGLGAATFGSIMGFAGGYKRAPAGLRWAERATYLFALMMVVANGVMIYALLDHDFSVAYVAQVGSRATPPFYTVVSLWSSLEGSILFWGAHLGVYVAAFTFLNRHRQRDLMTYALGTALAISAFFAFLIAGAGQSLLAGVAGASRWPGAQSAAAKSLSHDHPPAHAVLRLRGHDHPVCHRGGGPAARRAVGWLA